MKLPATFWSGIVTFIVTLIINAGISYYSGDQGLATMGRPVMLNGKVVLPLALENFSGKSISGLLMQVPEDVGVASIVRDAPVQITSASDSAGNLTRSIRIDGLEPRARTNLFVVLRDVTEAPLVRIINADDIGFSSADGVPESKLHRSITYGLMVAAIYAAIAVALGYYFNKMNESLHKKLDEANENSVKLRETSSKLRKELDDLKGMQSRIRVLLLSRISDYSAELDFWRNAVKELLLRRGAPASTSDELIQCVTRTLKTFGTRRGSDDFDAIVFAAAALKDAENRARQ